MFRTRSAGLDRLLLTRWMLPASCMRRKSWGVFQRVCLYLQLSFTGKRCAPSALMPVSRFRQPPRIRNGSTPIKWESYHRCCCCAPVQNMLRLRPQPNDWDLTLGRFAGWLVPRGVAGSDTSFFCEREWRWGHAACGAELDPATFAPMTRPTTACSCREFATSIDNSD